MHQGRLGPGGHAQLVVSDPLWPTGKQGATPRLSAVSQPRPGVWPGSSSGREGGRAEKQGQRRRQVSPAGSVVLGTGPGGPQPLLSPRAPGLRQPLRHGQFRPLKGVVQSSVDAEGAVVPFLLCQQDKSQLRRTAQVRIEMPARPTPWSFPVEGDGVQRASSRAGKGRPADKLLRQF